MKTMIKLNILIAFNQNFQALIEFFQSFQSLLMKTVIKLFENV